MVEETGVSYYGVAYPERALLDFQEMLDHGCNSVLLAVSEFDVDFWFQNVGRLISEAKALGLKVYLDLWGWGKTFGGEPPSIFLQENVGNRQVSVKGETLNVACFNTEAFRGYVLKAIERLGRETELDAFFWDEPHYAHGRTPADWSCRCPVCRGLFKEEYGFEMPQGLTAEVLEFRQSMILGFLGEMSRRVKETDPSKEVVLCLLPREDPGYGVPNWEKAFEIKEMDIFSTDPYWYHMPSEEGLRFFRERAGRAKTLSDRYGKRCQIWVQAFRVPNGREWELTQALEAAAEMGVYSLYAWPYRGGLGSVLASDRPELVWQTLGDAYKRLGAKTHR